MKSLASRKKKLALCSFALDVFISPVSSCVCSFHRSLLSALKIHRFGIGSTETGRVNASRGNIERTNRLILLSVFVVVFMKRVMLQLGF